MQPPNQHHRVNLVGLKAQIVKKLGPEGSKRYFYYLNRFLNLKLSKVEFNKLCLQIVGRENIPLHNQFIRSILKNACSAKAPPPMLDKQNVANPSVLLNGDIPAVSTRKVRTDFRDHYNLDSHKAFGPNASTNNSNSIFALENGDLTPHEIRRPVQHHQGRTEQAEVNEREVSYYPSGNISSTKRFPDGSVSLHSKEPGEAVRLEDKKEGFSRRLLSAPLGVPLCQVSVGGARRTTPLASSSFNSGGLLDTATLRQRMEQIAAAQGLEGVTMDCANFLNKGLDVYLKDLVTSCIELVGARSGHEFRSSTNKNQTHSKLVNGVRPGHHLHMHSSSNATESIRERKLDCPISLLDFRVAMELNPQQLGEDWPILLEKICTNAFEE